jgi:hypothetical protein
MTYYVGNENPIDSLVDGGRYFYGIRRTDDGTLYFTRVDQLSALGTLTINIPGPGNENFESFEYGVDFFDGRLATDHSRPFPNLYYDQYRWDNKSCYYYIDDTGSLRVRTNQPYVYDMSQIYSA